jgi:hypothetical protein
MPATSKAQQSLMALAEHVPSKVYKRNRAVLKMSLKSLRDFASTATKHLPQKVKKY